MTYYFLLHSCLILDIYFEYLSLHTLPILDIILILPLLSNPRHISGVLIPSYFADTLHNICPFSLVIIWFLTYISSTYPFILPWSLTYYLPLLTYQLLDIYLEYLPCTLFWSLTYISNTYPYISSVSGEIKLHTYMVFCSLKPIWSLSPSHQFKEFVLSFSIPDPL